MSYGSEWLAVIRWYLARAARRWDAFQARLPTIPKRWRDAFQARLPTIPRRWLVLLSVGGVVIYAVLVRCLHLLNHGHYFVLGPDSYLFHWLARRVMAGEGPPPDAPFASDIYTLHSGLAYPLAYIAKAVSSVFGLSPADALDIVSKSLPPLLGLISMLVIYLAAAKIYNRRVGLFSALAWALMLHALMIGAAGYLDRDGLSMLLIMTGALLFYLSKGWTFRLGNRDIGWLVAGLGVLVIELMLYLEWVWVGPVLLLAVILFYFAVRFLLGYLDSMKTELSTARMLAAAISTVNWRTFALIIVANVAVVIGMAALNPSQISSWWRIAKWALSGGAGVSELAPLTFSVFLSVYHWLLIPMAIGLYLIWKNRGEGSIFFACWFLVLLGGGLFAVRVAIFAVPAACMLAGLGLVFLWHWQGSGRLQPLKKLGVTAALCLAILLCGNQAYFLGSHPVMAAQEDWQDALAYIREDDTRGDAVIMAWWEQGKIILDMANLDGGQRRPLVDYGVYGFGAKELRDIAEAYATSDPAVAAGLMEKYRHDEQAVYLIVSTRELDDLASTILDRTEYKEEDEFHPDSLIVRSLNGEFDSEGGLEVVHRSALDPEGRYSVVVLGLTPDGQPQ